MNALAAGWIERLTVATTCAAVLAVVVCASAGADGLPVLGIDVGPQGVTTTASTHRYVALRAGRVTVVAQTARNGGRVLRYLRLPGSFTIPAVAYDGSAGGLSADERTLVLIQPRLGFPRADTTFAVVSTKRFAVTRTFTLSGDFSFDAISRNGRTLFLIQYTSPSDPTRYAVRAYDLPARQLLPQPIVDPHERGEAMRGSPITRTMSPDGRWAYTLYDGAGSTPFVHALDTGTRRARCIDLPMLAGARALWQMRIGRTPDGRALSVGAGASTAALISTTGFRVTVPTVGSPGSISHTWLFVAAAALVLALALGLGAGLRRLRARPLTA
jgi:hypothetical protein